MIAYPNDYDKIVIVFYPPFAGGKFLINNLGLNDQAVFQHSDLARRQIDNDFSYTDKIKYLSTQLKSAAKNAHWNDLELGCIQLFGYRGLDYQIEYPEILADQINPIVQTIISENLILFLCAHDIMALRSELNFWTNAKVIGFTNSDNFIKERLPKIFDHDKFRKIRSNYWNVVKGESWPELPPRTESEFLLLPAHVQSDLVGNFGNSISKWFLVESRRTKLFENSLAHIKKELGTRFYQIDVDEFYKDESTFLSTLTDCLQWLDLPRPRDDRHNRQYFQEWKATLNLINTANQGN
jgi:hypothetical protein